MPGDDFEPPSVPADARPHGVHHRAVNSSLQDVRPPSHAQDYQDDDLRGLLREAGFDTYSAPGRERFINYMRANLERNIRDQNRLALRQKTLMGVLALTGAALFGGFVNILRQLLPESLGKWVP